jgi:hypothetical protein
MASVGAVSHDVYGLISAGPVPSAAEPAGVGAPAGASPAPATPVAAGAGKPGTAEDVVTANVAAKGSVDLVGTPSPEYLNAMSQIARTAANNAPRVGGRLDTQM